RLGDYSTSTVAGNLRSSIDEQMTIAVPYTINVNYGGHNGDRLSCSFTDSSTTSHVFDYKLEAYNREIFHSATKEDQNMYIKLINADPFEKTTQVTVKDLSIEQEGKLICLTGEATEIGRASCRERGEK